jgi:hypothetical protein
LFKVILKLILEDDIMKRAVIFSIGLSFIFCNMALAIPEGGLVHDFEDGTLQGWTSGADLANVSTGGPAGVGDNYLEIARTESSFHLGANNQTDWTGDYLAAGVKAIAMDADTFSVTTGPTDLSLRIVIFGPGGAFSTKDPIVVITTGGWQNIEFGLTRSDLVRVFGSSNKPGGYQDPGAQIDDLTATLRNVERLLIRHDPDPAPSPIGTHPQHVRAIIGLDNITTVLGPAPTYDLAWTFSNSGSTSYILDLFEPNDVPFAAVGAEDPDLLLNLDKRYQVTVTSFSTHPFEVIAKAATSGSDDVLLSMGAPDDPYESDPNVAWDDNGIGTVTFTLTSDLYDAMKVPNKKPGYRCGVHVSNMRGNFNICAPQTPADLSGNCHVDFDDVLLFMSQWLENPGSTANLDGFDGVNLADFAIIAFHWLECDIDPPGACL